MKLNDLNDVHCSIHNYNCFSSPMPCKGPILSALPGSTSIEVVVITYHHDEVLKTLINSAKAQILAEHFDGTHEPGFHVNYNDNWSPYPNWKLHIIHDGNDDFYRKMKDDLTRNGYLDERITYTCSEEREGQVGHANRHYGLMNLVSKDSDYVLITNGDNYLVPTIFQWIDVVHRLHNPDLIYWDIVQREVQDSQNRGGLSSHLSPGRIDWASVALKTKIAQSVGVTSRDYAADWHYIVDALGITPDNNIPKISTYKIGKILAVHN